MKLYCKLFITALLFAACNQNYETTATENIPLYPDPVTVTIDTTKGYAINSITGDSIKPLINSYGDIIKTGVSISLKGVFHTPEKIASVKNSKDVNPTEIINSKNLDSLPQKLTIITVNTVQLKKVKCGQGIRINATVKKMPFYEPHPVKALPLRFKDAATANVQYLDVDQGMSSSYIYSILEDKKGNLWFGTDGAGISKYDGVSFIHYGKKEGLSENTVYSMMEDSKNDIWIGTNNGLNKFDGKNFTQYNEGFNGNIIYSIIEDRKGKIWFGTTGGLVMFNGTNFIKYTTKEGLPSDTVRVCIEDKNGNIWLGSDRGAAKFDGKNFTQYTKEDGLIYSCISSLLQDRNGNIWMGSRMGLNKFDGKNFTHYTEKDGLSFGSDTRSMIEDKNGNIWLGTTFGGIIKFDGKNFTPFNQSEGISNNKVRSIIEDSNGNIWFGTDGGGVNKLDDAGLSYLSHNEVLANNRIRPIIKDKKGNTWFGTEGAGIGKYNAAGITYYTIKDQAPFTGQRSLLEDSKGNIWIGTTEGGLYKFDGNYFIDYAEHERKAENTIFCLHEDASGNIWYGKNMDGLIKFDGKFFSNYTEKEGLPAKTIFSIYEDKKGNLWLGTDGGGLAKYNGSQLINYTEREGLFSKSITSIIDDNNGNLWLGTLGAGVCKFDGKQFTYYTEKEGLSNNSVWSLIKDTAGNIWAGTDNGLNQFIKLNSNYIIYKYGLQDGLKAVDFNLHSACIDNNNRIWWGTGKNVVIKDLNKPSKTYNVHSLKLSFIEINDKFYDYHNFPDSLGKQITFSDVSPFNSYPNNLKNTHDQNHLSFHFSAIDWSAPYKIKYSYCLLGLDNKWSKPSEETMADYRNLPYGNYTFQIRSAGQSKVWTEPFTYSFTIVPAWWQTWWFKALVIVTILMVAFFIGRFIYFYQLRKQRIVLEKQLAVQYERQRISAEMHDDIGAGLSGIRLLTEMTKTKVKDQPAIEEVEKIYQSLGDISSKMREVIWSLNTENDNLSNLITYIQKQARLWLEHYPCQLVIETPEIIPDVTITGEARRNIFLVVKETIHNIIKHSGADKVIIKMSCNHRFIISIADNGKGFTAIQNDGMGNGLKNMHQRIKALNGNIEIKNENGTILIFEIPLQPKA